MYSSPTVKRYHCSICGKEITELGSSPIECILCLKPLCAACEKAHLCPEHYNYLAPQQRRDLALYVLVQNWLESRRGVYGGGAVAIILVTFFTSLFLSLYLINPTPYNAVTFAIVGLSRTCILCLGAFGGPFLIYQRRRTNNFIRRIKRAIYSLLAPYATLGTYNKLSEYYRVEKPYRARHRTENSLGEIDQVHIEIPPNLQEVAVKSFSVWDPTYNCGICGAKVLIKSKERQKLYCHACYIRLCPQCIHGGLCPEHFAALDPQHQQELQQCFQEQQVLQVRVNHWVDLPAIPTAIFMWAILGGIALIAQQITGGVLLFLGGVAVIVAFFTYSIARLRHDHPALKRISLRLDALIQNLTPTLDHAAPTPGVGATPRASQPLSENSCPVPVQSSDVVIYCPTCHIGHPSFAEYCMKCGKRLPPQ